MSDYINLCSNFNKRTVATIEARMGSSRLPGKVLKPIEDDTILGFMIERVKLATTLDEIVVATTTSILDNPIEQFCSERNIKCFRGSESNVLERVYQTSVMAEADTIVELTGDCPLIDPHLIDQMVVSFYLNDVDCHTNTFHRSYPDGMDVQVIKAKALEKTNLEATSDYDREHVTPYIYRNLNDFKISHQIAPLNQHFPDLGLTLDEQSDYELILSIYEELEHPLSASLTDILNLINTGRVRLVNSNVKRKLKDK